MKALKIRALIALFFVGLRGMFLMNDFALTGGWRWLILPFSVVILPLGWGRFIGETAIKILQD